MTTLPETTLARLRSRAEGGHDDAKALLHLLARADAQDQWFAKFTDSYFRTIAALCRRLAALERGANLQQRDEDTEAAQPDSDADIAQRITDTATQIRREAVKLATTSALDHAGLIAFALGREPWSTWLQKGGCLESAHCELSDLMLAVLARWGHSTPPAPAAPVDDNPVANALTVAEAALADVAAGQGGRLCSATEKITWAKLRCTEALAAIRPVMRQHGIRTSEFPPAAPAPAPTTSPALQRLIKAPIDARGYVDLSERKPTPTPSPDAYAEGLAERIEQIFLDKTSTPGGPGLLVPDPEDPLGARLAIREIASSLRSWQCVPSVLNPSAWDAAEWLERQARR
jgi:hypothetical protein